MRHVELTQFIKWIDGIGLQLRSLFERRDRLLLAAQAAGQQAKVILQQVMAGEFVARLFKDANGFNVVGLAGIGLRQADISGIELRIGGERRMKGIARRGVVALDHLNRAQAQLEGSSEGGVSHAGLDNLDRLVVAVHVHQQTSVIERPVRVGGVGQ